MQLLAYFGEKDAKPCGICSVCTSIKKTVNPQDANFIKKRIIELLETGDQSSRNMIAALNCTETELKNVLKLLLEHDIISITPINTYKLSHL
jgi:ATP-dependent DNA helicase RecQ